MVIHKVSISNFRVYYDSNNVSFSTDVDKHISIIAGNNGFGKTSFLTALVWGLYGKLITDVDPRYRQDIYESGGYKLYCKKLLNRIAEENGESTFSVTIEFSDLMIPSVQCNSVKIIRAHNVSNNSEHVEILIDGKVNELTKIVGPEIFINDFILPKEIAKFFFFDAEKIVSLAEIKSADEKLYLSHAYSEVLGIRKYVDLKSNLVNVRLRLREKSAQKTDRAQLEKLNRQLVQNEKLLQVNKQEIEEKLESLLTKKTASDVHQERLIREGSSLSLKELKLLKEQQVKNGYELAQVKAKFNDLLELAPFAIAAYKVQQVKLQLENELNNNSISVSLLEQKLASIKEIIHYNRSTLSLDSVREEKIVELIENTLLPKSNIEHTVLLDFSPEQQNDFFSIHNNLLNSYNKTFRLVVAEQKRLQTIFSDLQRKLQDAESKENDPVIRAARLAKSKLDDEISRIESELLNLQNERNILEKETNTIAKLISELSKKVKIEINDEEKDLTAERLIRKLEKFILQLKLRKKESLERNILTELNRLMHKNFIDRVTVVVDGDLIEIELYDQQSRQIHKELLSKGEQQLYATALLKALIEESHIKFPLFIDSPLQKFDKTHSRNIINDFYPNIHGQVILFPLLKNELNEGEYKSLLPLIGKTYLINQSERYHSEFEETSPENLFDVYAANNQYV